VHHGEASARGCLAVKTGAQALKHGHKHCLPLGVHYAGMNRNAHATRRACVRWHSEGGALHKR